MKKNPDSLLTLLALWFVANFVPHVIVYGLTGKIYYQLAPCWVLVTESTIMLLNLVLPILVLSRVGEVRIRLREHLAWKGFGPRSLGLGLLGYLVFMAFAWGTNQTLGPPFGAPPGPPYSSTELAALVGLLLVLTAAGEETMFRGYLQTVLTRKHGACIGILTPAVLFGLRHLPMDIYNGLVLHAPPSAWISRLLQLYGLAVILGLVRHYSDSTWASWITHELLLVTVIVLSVL